MDSIYFVIGVVAIAILIILILMVNRRQVVMSGNIPMVSQDLFHSVQAELQKTQARVAEQEIELRAWMSKSAVLQQERDHLLQQIETLRHDASDVQKQMALQFEQIANRMLEEKGRVITQHQHQQLGHLLTPLHSKIREFQEDMDRRFLDESKDKTGLKKEIELLRDLNQQLSNDAHQLTSALKGQSKMQGDWGEYQLELILEKAGLLKGVHFQTQVSYTDDSGNQKRPDFVIELPDKKHLIVDAKVSLTAFERYHNATDAEQRKVHLKSHVESMRRHVDQLSRKNYTHLEQISSPDYLLLFVPIEGALSSASLADPDLFTDALERNVVIVSSTSLVATMRTVAHIWKQEKQARSVQEIAKQSGLLFDKFVAFVEDLKTVGQRLDSAQSAWQDAYNKLSQSAKYGDTLVGRAERIRALGARNSKFLPIELLNDIQEESEE
jgi:DNA recombination protein RmuC